MPLVIDSAPDCISSDPGTQEARVNDSADFVLADPWQDCAGFMTFGPGSTYGPDGVGAETSYMVLTWIGIIAMVVILIAWVAYENRRLLAFAAEHLRGGSPAARQPGITADDELERP